MKYAHSDDMIKEHVEKCISTKLSEVIKGNSMTLSQLAAEAGISTSYLKEIKSGVKRLNVETLYKLALALEIKPVELLPNEWQKDAPVNLDRELLSATIATVFKIKVDLESSSGHIYSPEALAAITETVFHSALIRSGELPSYAEIISMFKLTSL